MIQSGVPAHASGACGPANPRCERLVAELPSGRRLDLLRSRWCGPLDGEELAWCRANGVALAFDCAQIGWVCENCSDGLPPAAAVREVDLADFATPEPHARRLCRSLAASATPATIERLRASVADLVGDFHARHGVHAANRCHLALHTVLGRAGAERLPAPGGPGEFSFRPWTASDAPRYRAMLDSPRLWQYLPENHPQPMTEELARTLIELGRVDAHQQALAVLHGGEPVGQCLLRFHGEFAGVRTAEVAYWLAEEHWGKGWMSRILPAFLAHGCEEHELDAIEAWIREDNAASVRVAERSGLRRDTFAFERELAAALGKPRALRYVAFRGAAVTASLGSTPAG